jgi:NAD+ synthase (glutamine-hydrolysing)
MCQQGLKVKFILHQTHHTIADFEQIKQTLMDVFLNSKSEEVHLFPELYLTGYPLQDLCLILPFIKSYSRLRLELDQYFTQAQKTLNSALFLVGGLEYEMNQDHTAPIRIYNVMIKYTAGETGQVIYRKRLLPNYDIFDERKYFTPGEEAKILNIFNKNIGLLICEDMWKSGFHQVDPVQDLFELTLARQIKLDAIINLSASPYARDKQNSRVVRASEIAQQFGCPFIYVNRVGVEDEIIFDGASFVQGPEQLLIKAQSFKPQTLEYYLQSKDLCLPSPTFHATTHQSWESLLNAKIEKSPVGPIVTPWSDNYCAEVMQALCFGLQEYAKKNKFNKFLVALSGGMDSALVLTLAKFSLAAEQSIEAIYMPSQYSSSLSYELSEKLCQNLNIPLRSFPIKFLHSTANLAFGQNLSSPLSGLSDENIQSRLRGLIIYTRSNQTGAMVINTSNKSELAVGYSTQYGDSVGAISLLGDLFKSEIFQLAEYINRTYKMVIPQEIITRPPSAELRQGQKDTDSLPDYPILDGILECILSGQYDTQRMIELGGNKDTIEKVFNLYRNSEYKRYQFCPIIKIKARSFGFGYRVPLSKNARFFTV